MLKSIISIVEYTQYSGRKQQAILVLPPRWLWFLLILLNILHSTSDIRTVLVLSLNLLRVSLIILILPLYFGITSTVVMVSFTLFNIIHSPSDIRTVLVVSLNLLMVSFTILILALYFGITATVVIVSPHLFEYPQQY